MFDSGNSFQGDSRVNKLVPATTALIFILIGIAVVASLWRYQRRRRRHAALHQLLDDADQLESDLRECRQRLDRANAVMSVAPGVPVAGENKARQAVDAGLRSLLEHRLWIRDRSPHASQKELDQAVAALAQARAQLETQLRVLDQAQRGLEEAVRDRIERES